MPEGVWETEKLRWVANTTTSLRISVSNTSNLNEMTNGTHKGATQVPRG
jgi:hypothetical protein